jgi:hypothetical protein
MILLSSGFFDDWFYKHFCMGRGKRIFLGGSVGFVRMPA